MAGVITTSQTFANNDNVTSTTLNAIATGSAFGTITDVCANTTITVSAGKLKVGTITSTEMGTDSVLTANIANLNVTTAKLADTAVTTAKITDLNVTTGKIADLGVTTAKIADANVTTAKIADANVTAAKLSGAQTGSAPIYGARAAVDFNADAAVGGNCTIRKSFNVSSVKKTAVGKFEINIPNAIPTDFVCVVNTGSETGGAWASVVKAGSTGSLIKITTSNFSNYVDLSNNNVVIFA
jgi:hypothetical protein